MTKIPSDESERHPYLIHLARTLDRLIVDSDVKASWLASCLGISEALLSDYRSGRHAIPGYRAILVDDLLGTNRMGEALAGIGGHHLVQKDTENLTADQLEKLFPLILREQGAANADVASALMDHVLDGAEQDTIHRHAARLRHFWQQVEERTASMPRLRRAE